MKKNHKVIHTIIMGIFVAMIIVIAYIMTNDKIKSKEQGTKEDVISIPKGGEEYEKYLNKDGLVLPYDKITFAVNEPINTDDFTYTMKNALFTKNPIDSDAIYNMWENEPIQFLEDGTITNDYSYVAVDIVIKNNSNEVRENYLSTFQFVAIDPKTNDIYGDVYAAGQLRGYKPKSAGQVIDRSYFSKQYQPQEEFSCKLVFIQKDSDIQENIPYVKIAPSGIAVYETSSRYIKLLKEEI